MTHTADSEVQYFQSEGKAIYASVGRGYEALFKYADPATTTAMGVKLIAQPWPPNARPPNAQQSGSLRSYPL